MYNLKTEERTVKELLEGLKGGLLIREGLQRTPSHDTKKSNEIISSIFAGRYCGALHFATIKDNEKVLSILDGSSRLQDLQDFTNNVEGVYLKKSVYDTEEEKEKIEKIAFKDLSEEEKRAFMGYKFPCVILSNVDNATTFVNLNSSTSLNMIQKCKGNLGEEFTNIIDMFKNSKIVNNCLSARQLQKDELILVVFQILSNIYGVYSATNKKLVANVKETNLLNFNIERMQGILTKFDNVSCDINKYCLISLISVLYNSPLNLEQIPNFDNNIVFKVETQGANSKPANDKRINKACKILNDTLGVSVKTGRKIIKGDNSTVEVEEVVVDASTDLNELLG